MARKTTTSTEVKTRWKQKAYQQYNVNLRKDDDKELIEYVERKKAEGYNTTEVFREALENINGK